MDISKEEDTDWQVVSLELSKKLKELGVKQKSIFYWNDSDPSGYFRIEFYEEVCRLPTNCSAFTVGELVEILPTRFLYNDSAEHVYLFIKKYPHEYYISYCDLDDEWFDWNQTKDESLANALAKMLISCIENGLMKVKND